MERGKSGWNGGGRVSSIYRGGQERGGEGNRRIRRGSGLLRRGKERGGRKERGDRDGIRTGGGSRMSARERKGESVRATDTMRIRIRRVDLGPDLLTGRNGGFLNSAQFFLFKTFFLFFKAGKKNEERKINIHSNIEVLYTKMLIKINSIRWTFFHGQK